MFLVAVLAVILVYFFNFSVLAGIGLAFLIGLLLD